LVNSFLEIFNQFKTILCLCPNCNSISRLSDLHLRSKGKAPKTWLDDYESSVQKLAERETKFADEEDKIRKEAAERGRTKVPEIVRQSMDTQFAKLNYDPYDIKPLLHPVEFAIFDGMNNGDIDNVILLSRISSNPSLQSLQKSVAKAIDDKLYDWKVARVSLDGNVDFE
jgi:predicted Holliday junction resolvase-like endonuclease